MPDKATETGETEVKETADVQVVVEAGATADLSKRNIELLEKKDKYEQEVQNRLIKENKELAEKAAEARDEAIKSEVRALLAAGYITSQQAESGLAEALAAIPDDAKPIGDKARHPRQILIEALMYGGKLKLKLEIAKDILNNDPTDTLAKARAHGIDTSVDERRIQLMADNPEMNHADALDRAIREVRK